MRIEYLAYFILIGVLKYKAEMIRGEDHMKDKEQLKVASYNIRTNTQEDAYTKKDHLWDNRFAYIKKMMIENDWDVIGFQEPSRKQLKDLATLTDYDFVGEIRSADADAEYSPIFFKKDQFTLLDSSTKWLSETPEVPSETESWRASLPRIVTIAHLQSKKTEQKFYFINTHFDHVSEEARYQSAHLITHLLDGFEPHTPVFLTGDFNGDREERWYSVISEKIDDSELESPHHVGPDVTCTGVVFDYIPKWEDMLKIDYIFVNDLVTVEKTEVLTDRFSFGYPSDHLPVSLTCRI